MTQNAKIALGGAALALLIFAAKRKKVTAIVDFEAPTVSGAGAGKFGGTSFEAGYGVEKPLYGPPDPFGHTETETERLIRISNEAAGGELMEGDGFLGLRSPGTSSYTVD